MGETVTAKLAGALDGRTVQVDADGLTVGLMEDLQSGNFTKMLDGLAGVLVGGDLPQGVDRDGLRKLKLPQMKALVEGVVSGVTGIPKS